MKRLFVLSLGALIIFGACKKADHGSGYGIKISVIAGNDQSDTVGRVLGDSIKVSVTRGNLPLPNASLKIVWPGCAYSLTNYGATGLDGTASFQWQLNATIGTQDMIIYVMDSVLGAVDSTTAMATGTFADHAWLPSNCVPQYSNGIESFGQLPSGRVFYSPSDKVYYSDDNGANWSVLSSFPGQGSLNNFAVYGNTVFVWSGFGGIQYSADGGATWKSLSTVANFGQLTWLSITRNGKLFLSAAAGVLMSRDLGQTWTNISDQPNNYLGYGSYFGNFCEAADGTIFTANTSGELWESEDSGVSWAKSFAINQAVGVFSDSTGTIYVSTTGAMDGGLSRMVNSGYGFVASPLCSFQDVEGNVAAIRSLSVVNNTFYFMLDGYGLMKTTDFVSIQNVTGQPISAFCVTKTGAAIVSALSTYDFPIAYDLHP